MNVQEDVWPMRERLGSGAPHWQSKSDDVATLQSASWGRTEVGQGRAGGGDRWVEARDRGLEPELGLATSSQHLELRW